MLKFKKICIGVSISIAVFAAAVAVASLCIVKTGSLPNTGTAAFIVTILCGAAAFAGAWSAARTAGERGLLHGAFIGAVCTAVYIAAVMMKCSVLSAVTAVRVLLFMLSGAAGGVTGVNKGKEKIQF